MHDSKLWRKHKDLTRTATRRRGVLVQTPRAQSQTPPPAAVRGVDVAGALVGYWEMDATGFS